MPRVRLKAKDYARSDFRAWISDEMRTRSMTNADMGQLLGYTGQNFGRKLKIMGFSYAELVKILSELECPESKLIYFMKGEK